MNPQDRPDPVVQVTDLRKKRGPHQALDGISFTIPRGRIFGLIGPNGAGKTTTIKILLGLLRPDSGSAEVLGEAPMELSVAARQRIGYLAERSERSELPNLPIAELLEYQSHFFASWDWAWCGQLIERMGVVKTRPLEELSEGERRKAELLVELAHRPELLILDDPALGLDARARRDILWASLAAARDHGTTILFTSHILQDVERVVDDVLILDRGVVRMQGALDEVLEKTKRLVFPAVEAVPAVEGEVHRTRHGRDLTVVTNRFTPRLLDEMKGRHPGVHAEPMNLEEIFCAVAADPEPDPAGEKRP